MHLKTLPSRKDRIIALTAQLTFRKTVLCQPVMNKRVFNFSNKDDGIFTEDRLINNVVQLINDSYSLDSSADPDVDSYLNGQHKLIMDNDTDEPQQWYVGQVIGQVPGFPTWFNIVYDNDDAVYTYQLLEDLAAGELEVILPGGDTHDTQDDLHPLSSEGDMYIRITYNKMAAAWCSIGVIC
jgi:hypothetical protein